LCATQQSCRQSWLAFSCHAHLAQLPSPPAQHSPPPLLLCPPAHRKWPQEFDYSQEAPRGHLPLTNALRGTRLFEAILEHEAFEKKAVGSGSGAGSK
jgi:hypothetical protein